jgi:hypothetical protein
MKKQIISIITPVILGLFFSCSNKENKTSDAEVSGKEDLVLISPFIESRVMVCDTTQLDLIKDQERLKAYKADHTGMFLDEKALEELKKQLKLTFNDPNALIYFATNSESVIPVSDRKKMWLICDSLTQSNVDANGKEVTTSVFMCDSTAFWDRMTSVRFYESWYYNKRSGEIVKKQLGYSMLQWDYEKAAYREPYIYFTSKESKEVVAKNF